MSVDTSLQRELRAANRNIDRLTASNERRDREIANLITAHHTEKMFLLNNLESRMTELMRLHQQLVGQLNVQENRLTTVPALHGFALTIYPLPEEGAHEIRFIAGQEKYVTKEAAAATGLLFDFTETGNPIDLRQNFKRKANARLQARVGAYLHNHPVRLFCTSIFWRRIFN
jgi:hypothetical protein